MELIVGLMDRSICPSEQANPAMKIGHWRQDWRQTPSEANVHGDDPLLVRQVLYQLS